MTAAVNFLRCGWSKKTKFILCAQRSTDTDVAGTGYKRDLTRRPDRGVCNLAFYSIIVHLSRFPSTEGSLLRSYPVILIMCVLHVIICKPIYCVSIGLGFTVQSLSFPESRLFWVGCMYNRAAHIRSLRFFFQAFPQIEAPSICFRASWPPSASSYQSETHDPPTYVTRCGFCSASEAFILRGGWPSRCPGTGRFGSGTCWRAAVPT